MKKIGWFGLAGVRPHIARLRPSVDQCEPCPFARFLEKVSCYSANCDLMRSETHKKPQLIVDKPVTAA
jgi:hypothetical protein